MDATLRIKNLSIALEALSRLSYISYGDRVFALLGQAIAEAEKEQNEATQWPRKPARASTTDTNYDPYEPF